MRNQALASLAAEVGDKVGDTSAAFIARIKIWLNDRYEDALLRSGATMWTGASLAALADSDVPILGLGKVIKQGALAEAWEKKRQYKKAGVHEGKYEFALANYIISGDYNLFNISMSRYPTY